MDHLFQNLRTESGAFRLKGKPFLGDPHKNLSQVLSMIALGIIKFHFDVSRAGLVLFRSR
jgi:hypothetical protein